MNRRHISNLKSVLGDFAPWFTAWLILVACLALFNSCSTARADDVYFPLGNFASGSVASRKVLVTPLSLFPATNQLAVYDPQMLTSTTNGTLTVSNMVQGLYRADIQAPPKLTSFYFFVPANGTGGALVWANTILRVTPQQVNRPQDYAYSADASDARYATAAAVAAIPIGITNGQSTVTLPTLQTTNPIISGNISANGKLSVSNDVAGRADLGIASLDILGPVGGTNIHLGNDGITSLQPITYNNVLVQPGQFATFDANKRIVGTNDVPASSLTGTVPLANLSGITSNQFDTETKAQLALAGGSATLSGNGSSVSNTVNATSVGSGVTNQWRTEIATATNNPALAFTNKTQTFYSPLTLATRLTVLSDNAIYAGGGRTMQFNGATAPAYDYYSEVMRVLMHASTTRFSLIEGSSGNAYSLLSYYPGILQLFLSNSVMAGTYYGRGQSLDFTSLPNPQAIAQLLPKPYVQFQALDVTGGTYLSSEARFTNAVNSIKTNGFMVVMTNMGILPIINIDTCWNGTNRNFPGGYLTNDDQVKFPRPMKTLAAIAHTNGMRFGLSIYFETNYIPGATANTTVSPVQLAKEVMMTADSIQRDVRWFYTNDVDSLRIQDVDSGKFSAAVALLARAVGNAVLSPFNFGWNMTNPNENFVTNARPMAITALMANWPPPSDLWAGVNVVSWDATYPTSPSFRTPAGTRWLYTNMVPMTSVGHYFECFFLSPDSTTAKDVHNLSQVAMMNEGMQFVVADTANIFGSSAFQAVAQNTNMLSIHQDVGGLPDFRIRLIYDNGTNSAWVKTLTGQNRAAVWFINEQAGNVNMGVTMDQLGLNAAYTYSVTNVWANTNGGSYYGGFTNLVQANDSALFILDRVAGRAPVFYTSTTTAPTPGLIGAGNGVNWVSNGILYFSYTTDGTTSNNAVKIAP